jgi:hypothetical protein
MTHPRLLGFIVVVLGLGSLPSTAVGQDTTEPRNSFQRKYIDADSYRDDKIQLWDWPALTELVVWSRDLESAVANSDQTLAGELIAEFAARVDSLEGHALPRFLAVRSDSVEAALAGIQSALERAEAVVSAIPEARVTAQPGRASADRQKQRTLVTGSTAVTVPAGVAVGSARDSLPTVAFEAGESVNFVDLVALALVELDRVVHLVRNAGKEARPEVIGRPSAPGSTPARDTPLPRSAP